MDSESTSRVDLSSWIQVRLDRKPWRPADLANAMGVTNSMVSKWLKKGRVPEPAMVKRIAAALDADVADAFRALGWLETPTADTPLQADVIATIRRRNIDDQTAKTLLSVIDSLEPKGK